MHKYKFYLVGIALLLSLVLKGQNSFADASYALPFELTSHNNIAVNAVLNDTDNVRLMFHTASSAMTLTTQASKNLTSVHWNKQENVSSWGGKTTARFSESNTLAIGDLRWDGISIWENTNSGPTTDGKIGPNLFLGKIIEIDFDNSVLMIHEALPKRAENFTKLPLLIEDENMFLQATSTIGGKSYQNRFLIHSGFGGTILFDDQFVLDSKLGEQIDIIAESELKDSYGNVLKTKKGVLPKYTIGDVDFTDIPVGFFEGKVGRQQISVIGGDILKRFNIIIDQENAYVYIKPNKLMGSPYNTL